MNDYYLIFLKKTMDLNKISRINLYEWNKKANE